MRKRRVCSVAGIYHKEWQQTFHTMTGYVFLAMFVAMTGALFVLVNLVPQNGDIKALFAAMINVVVFLIPMLTMRLYSEERKQRTDELLLTAPVTATQIILGKFLAAWAIFALALAVTAVFPAILATFGAFAPLETLGNYLGLLLLAAALLAIGLFVSVLSESPFVAAVLTYATFSFMLVLGSIAPSYDGTLLGGLTHFAAMPSHMTPFSYGILDFGEAIYFGSIAALFLFLCVFALEQKRVA